MHPPPFPHLVLHAPRRLALPIAVYPALALTGARVSDLVQHAPAQVEAQLALRHRYRSPFALSAMDLSAEAEAFGCEIALSNHEVPTVTGHLVSSLDQARTLPIPQPGDRRTAVYLETVRLLSQPPNPPFVLAGCIGPFSLAARLAGVSETMELTVTQPEIVHTLLEKSATFLTRYLLAFRAAGAQGAIMAEPAAGLLSPRALAEFSSAYVRSIAAQLPTADFSLILHNCAAKRLHLPAILESGLSTFHFGAPMDILDALRHVPPQTILCGNLDPAGVFVSLPPAEVAAQTRSLLASTASYPNFVLSSGCDLPPNVPLTNLDAFYAAATDSPPPPPTSALPSS